MRQPTTGLQAPREPESEQESEPQRRAGEVHSINSARTPGSEQGPDPADGAGAEAVEALNGRLGRLERSNRLLRYALLALSLCTAYIAIDKVFPEGVIVQKTMLESKELKLLDNAGNARLFLRMYSRVPVLQLVDGNGKPRLSLGLRFDDTPFIDLSDSTGNPRATLEITEDDSAALRLFDENGDVSFKIN